MKLEGADKLLKGVAGGLDGVYAVASCENGRPLYKRQGSAPGRACPSAQCMRTHFQTCGLWAADAVVHVYALRFKACFAPF